MKLPEVQHEYGGSIGYLIGEIAKNINILGDFCGKRDVWELSHENLNKKYGFEKADVMVLFGGSIIVGGDVLAKAMKEEIAKTYVIVGGAGHTTETLRQKVHEEYPDIETAGLCEAEVFDRYLIHNYGIQADYLETGSTNCGNNITYLLELLDQNHISWNSIILCQDATMQNRMDAGFRKYAPGKIIINYAAYFAEVIQKDEKLCYAKEIHGMWSLERYVNLLMGEIPRLTDNEEGYGPKGKDFIAHVEVPIIVQEAFDELKYVYGDKTRKANSLYASK